MFKFWFWLVLIPVFVWAKFTKSTDNIEHELLFGLESDVQELAQSEFLADLNNVIPSATFLLEKPTIILSKPVVQQRSFELSEWNAFQQWKLEQKSDVITAAPFSGSMIFPFESISLPSFSLGVVVTLLAWLFWVWFMKRSVVPANKPLNMRFSVRLLYWTLPLIFSLLIVAWLQELSSMMVLAQAHYQDALGTTYCRLKSRPLTSIITHVKHSSM